MNLKFTTRDILIISAILSSMALVGGMLFQGVYYGGMLSFILAANMAPLGLAILVFWGLKIFKWNREYSTS